MTPALWGVVAVLALGMFGLGCITAVTMVLHRRNRGGAEGMLSDRRANLILAVFFTLIALGIGVDNVWLQVKVNRYMHAQVDCNTRLINNEVVVSEQRELVDQAAANYDIALHDWLYISTTRAVIAADDPAYLKLESALHEVTDARLGMLRVYAGHPFVSC